MNFQIITDSGSDLPLELVNRYNIDIVNFMIRIGEEELIDDMGEKFDKNAFFQRLKNGETASTSQINVHSYIEKFKFYIEKEIPVVYLAFSSALSGTFNSAVQAKKILEEEYEEVNIDIIDTKAASLGQGLLVYEACQKKQEGYTREELIDWVEDNKLNYHSLVTVDDVKHLQRGGRISATTATVGSLLNVKPIIVVNTEGELVPAAKVRGRKKALNYLVDQTIKHLTETDKHSIFIGHVGVIEEAEFIKEKLLERANPREIIVSSYGPTIAAHTGYGSLSVFSYGDKRTG
ncbi:DegV family protein [Alkalibacterium sp. 20]|uniref:DegV family protein n=1 Tax=Alkalibacterium sp. 20 TaxID=1798803 RepID=UPI0009000ECC|nr:DegV family protein [Alkalibacterium sp. 20]OJF89747.1 fatty acid-binding protein DegV [Alkalibacterium sp. 20]